MELVSVIIPYYKKKEYIKQTINSVLNQTYQNFEIIIIYDDNDRDDLVFVTDLKKLDKRIYLIINSKNVGAGLSRNKGIQNANGEYIAFLDSDDVWNVNKLELQIQFMKEKNIDFSFTAFDIIDLFDQKIGHRSARTFLNLDNLIKSCDVGTSTVIVKKFLLNKFCIFPNLKTKEDYVLWLQLAKKNIGLYGLNTTLSKWRFAKNSLSSNTKQKILDAFLVYKKYMKFSFVKSCYCVFVLSLNYLVKKFL